MVPFWLGCVKRAHFSHVMFAVINRILKTSLKYFCLWSGCCVHCLVLCIVVSLLQFLLPSFPGLSLYSFFKWKDFQLNQTFTCFWINIGVYVCVVKFALNASWLYVKLAEIRRCLPMFWVRVMWLCCVFLLFYPASKQSNLGSDL